MRVGVRVSVGLSFPTQLELRDYAPVRRGAFGVPDFPRVRKCAPFLASPPRLGRIDGPADSPLSPGVSPSEMILWLVLPPSRLHRVRCGIEKRSVRGWLRELGRVYAHSADGLKVTS